MSRAALNKLDYDDDDDDDDVVDARQKGICEDKFSKNKMKKKSRTRLLQENTPEILVCPGVSELFFILQDRITP